MTIFACDSSNSSNKEAEFFDADAFDSRNFFRIFFRWKTSRFCEGPHSNRPNREFSVQNGLSTSKNHLTANDRERDFLIKPLKIRPWVDLLKAIVPNLMIKCARNAVRVRRTITFEMSHSPQSWPENMQGHSLKDQDVGNEIHKTVLKSTQTTRPVAQSDNSE